MKIKQYPCVSRLEFCYFIKIRCRRLPVVNESSKLELELRNTKYWKTLTKETHLYPYQRNMEKQNFVNRVKMRVSPYVDLDKACYMWNLKAPHQIIPKSRTIFKVKEIGCDNFQVSNGWLERWKKRYNVSFKISCTFSYHQVRYLKYLYTNFADKIKMKPSFPFHRLS